MIHPKSVMSNMFFFFFFLRLVLRRYLQESEWFLPTRFLILGSHPFIKNFPMPIDGRFPNLGFLEGYHAMPMPCHFCDCCFRRKLHGQRESCGVGRLPDACLGGWLGPEICRASGENLGGNPWCGWVSMSWHQRVGKKTCQLMRIDGRDLHFIWYFWLTVRGKWWLTSLDKCEHGNWTGFWDHGHLMWLLTF